MARFRPGSSGNPQGRPRGIVNKRVQLCALVEGHAEALVAKALDLALNQNDTAALRLRVERVIPALRARDKPVRVPVPARGTLTEQGQAVLAVLGRGTLAPSEAGAAFTALVGQAPLREIDKIQQRLSALETRLTAEGR